ncbi:hypothetical protein [Nakamurella endophytica]|nr:hypothetical protein [Nakamurella endophytica]
MTNNWYATDLIIKQHQDDLRREVARAGRRSAAHRRDVRTAGGVRRLWAATRVPDARPLPGGALRTA